MSYTYSFIQPYTDAAFLGGFVVGLPLDDVAGSTAAYSTRLLRAAYAGQCLRVRRDGGSPGEQDIGFSAGVLDTATLLTYCSGVNGFVVTWYDQSGNTRDVTQATAGNQPQIVTAGALTRTMGGQPAIDFNATWLEASVGTTIVTASTGTIFTVFVADSAVTGGIIYNNGSLWMITNTGDMGAQFDTGPQITAYNWDGNADGSPAAISFGTDYVHGWRHGSGNLDGFLNSATFGTTVSGNTTPFSNNQFRIGRNYTTSNHDGAIVELICYDTALSNGNANQLGVDMADPYGITWT